MSSTETVGQIWGLPRELGRDDLVIGTDERQALVRIDGAEGVHAVISYVREGFKDGQWWIEDKSKCGTWLNGERMSGRTRLVNGDCICISGANILFSNGWLREDHRQAQGVRVDVRDLSDSRDGKTILRSVSFTAKEGEFIGILGPSGCGKSSVIQRVAGLARFESGSITVNGHFVAEENADLQRLVAYLPQNVDDSLHRGLTPCEEMKYARRIFLAPDEDAEALDAQTLEELDLSKVKDKPVGKLSGGEKRRVAIALAYLRNPQMLLLDEPTAGLDPATEKEVMDQLHRLARQGRTVICATHVMENIALFDKVLVMAGGEKINGAPVYFGSPKGILEWFGVSSYPELYARLKDDQCRPMSDENDAATPEPWDLPQPPEKASFVRSVRGYLSRSWAEFRATFRNPVTKFDQFIPSPVRTLFVQPLLLVLGIKCACAKMFSEQTIGGIGGGVSTVLFCAAIAVFWLGLIGNVQGLVRDRVPRRCLERLGGVPLIRYGVAKLITLIGPCMIQAFVFSVLLFVLPEIGHKSSDKSFLVASFAVGAVLSLVCLMGGLIGTVVSAFARSSTGAVGFVPLVVAFALFFSQPVIGFDMSDRAEYGVAERIAEWMPCYRPQVCMCVLEEQHVLNDGKDGRYPQEEKAPAQLAGLFGLYLVLSVGLSLFAQSRNERAWEGR